MQNILIVLRLYFQTVWRIEAGSNFETEMSSVAKPKRTQTETQKRVGNPGAITKTSPTVPPSIDLKEVIDSAR